MNQIVSICGTCRSLAAFCSCTPADQRKPTPTVAAVLAFLLGEAPLDGLHFGEPALDRPRYWWRSSLRETMRRALLALDLLERVEHLAVAGYVARVQLRDGQPHVSAANVHESVEQAVNKQRTEAWRQLEDERDRLLEERDNLAAELLEERNRAP